MRLSLGLGLTKNGASSSSPYLDGAVNSAVADLDSTQSDSYGGSGQTWANLIASPADGSSQTDHDWYLGLGSSSEASDPTFTGTAGESTAYWSHDGGDYFRLALEIDSATVPQFLEDIGKSALDWWIFSNFRTPSTIGNFAIFSNWDTINGLLIFYNTAGFIRVLQEQGGTISTNDYTITLTADTDYMVLATYDDSADILKVYINETSSPTTFNPANFVAGSNDGPGPYNLFARANGTLAPSNGHRTYNISYGNAFLSDADVSSIMNHIAARQPDGRYSFL